jgi:cell wall assembly regulator SMI1
VRVNDPLERVERDLDLRLPDVLKDLYASGDGRYNSGGEWWVVWPTARLVEENRRAWQNGLPRTYFTFGDDGTGDPFYIDLEVVDGEVQRWSWIDNASQGVVGTISEFRAIWIEGA